MCNHCKHGKILIQQLFLFILKQILFTLWTGKAVQKRFKGVLLCCFDPCLMMYEIYLTYSLIGFTYHVRYIYARFGTLALKGSYNVM